MIQKNGYFRLEWNNKDAICHLYPPVSDGLPVEIRELTSYLDSCGFSNKYNLKALKDAIDSGVESAVSVGSGDGIELSEAMGDYISADKMTFSARFYPPSIGGKHMNAGDIIGYFKSNGIKVGIDQEAISEFIKNPVYCTDVVFARGKEPVQGHDASIEYFFNTNLSAVPTKLEDGTVDFKNIDVIARVEKGDLLARLHPEDRGEPGFDLYGNRIPPRSVNSARLSGGRNIRFSEDRTEIYTEVTGHATLAGNQVFVSDVYEVPADVDNSTGNIDYEGSIHIKGNVRSGFEVVAKGDIIIDGSVEGALIMSEGQIIIARGINGMGHGVLQANGNIITKFIENAKVISGGFVDSGAIIHSDVTATGEVIVASHKGFITGSTVKAGTAVKANTIGSSMGAVSTIEVGMDPAKKGRFTEITTTINQLNTENNKIMPVVKNYSDILAAGKKLDAKNQEYYIKLLQVVKANQEKLAAYTAEYEKLKPEMAAGSIAKVEVKRDIFPGVSVTISDASITVKDKRSFCRLVKKGADIVFENM